MELSCISKTDVFFWSPIYQARIVLSDNRVAFTLPAWYSQVLPCSKVTGSARYPAGSRFHSVEWNGVLGDRLPAGNNSCQYVLYAV